LFGASIPVREESGAGRTGSENLYERGSDRAIGLLESFFLAEALLEERPHPPPSTQSPAGRGGGEEKERTVAHASGAHTKTMELLGTVTVMLSNPTVQAVVIDRQPGRSPFVMAFSLPWNTLREMAERKESLTKVLVAGGPVERGEP
jgi:hypothetical protein